MFNCPACLDRAVTSLVQSHTPLQHSLFKPYPLAASVQRASHSTWSNIRKGHHIREIRKVLKKKQYRKQPKGGAAPGSDVLYPTKISINVQRTLRAREANKKTLDETLTIQRSSPIPIDWGAQGDPVEQRAVENELEFLKDPLRLASHVSNLLRDNKIAKSINLIRASQRLGIKNIVSWNHLLAYLMHTGRVAEAVDAYNQMKKRGTRPDSYTYMMMLRGLAQNATWKKAVSQALAIYNSMDAPNSVIHPTTGHSNAMIGVCAKAGDFDAMFGIAGKMPHRGRNAPDAWTYTIILSAFSSKIKELNMDQSGKLIPERKATETHNTVKEGWQVWEDIMSKWRAGDLSVDEPLVVAMGHLILSTFNLADARHIFPLIRQTTGIPEPVLDVQKSQAPPHRERAPNNDGHLSSGDSEVVAPSSGQASVPWSDEGSQPSSAYVQAGNGIFTLSLRAARILSSITIAKYYIKIFTEPSSKYRIGNMDDISYKEYFRVLDSSRASRETGDVLENLLNSGNKDLAVQFAFVMAMNVCRRDILNPNIFDNATRILDLYEAHTSKASDPRPIISYLQIVRGITPGQNGLAVTERKDPQYFESDPEKNMLVRAIRKAFPHFREVRVRVDRTFRPEDPFAPQDDEHSDYREARAADRVFLDSARKLAKLLQSSVDLAVRDKVRADKLGPKVCDELLEYRSKAVNWVDRMSEWEPQAERGADGWKEMRHGKIESARQGRRRLRSRGKREWQAIDPDAVEEVGGKEDNGRELVGIVDRLLGPKAESKSLFYQDDVRGQGELARAG